MTGLREHLEQHAKEQERQAKFTVDYGGFRWGLMEYPLGDSWICEHNGRTGVIELDQLDGQCLYRAMGKGRPPRAYFHHLTHAMDWVIGHVLNDESQTGG